MREEGTASGRSLVPTRDRRISALPREKLTALHRRDALADQWAVQREGGRATGWGGKRTLQVADWREILIYNVTA